MTFFRAFLDSFVRNYRAARLGIPAELMPHLEQLEAGIADRYREAVAARERALLYGSGNPDQPPVGLLRQDAAAAQATPAHETPAAPAAPTPPVPKGTVH